MATLTVVDPFILSQPVSRNANLGDTITFSIMAGGTAPLGYQWRKNGADLPGQASQTLAFAAFTAAAAGDYTCVVSNALGAAKSAVALLLVIAGSVAWPVTVPRML